MKRETDDMPTKAIKYFIGDETNASKKYAALGKKYHDPKLAQMAKDEKHHQEYWKKVLKEKKR